MKIIAIFLTLSFLNFNSVLSARSDINLALNAETRNDTNETTTTIPPFHPDFDYIVQLIYDISESKVPNHLINLVYDSSLEKNISSRDVFALFKVSNLTINQTLDILELLQVNAQSVFSLNGLNHTLTELNEAFKDFYISLTNTLNLTGLPLRNALDSLGINSAQFSSGITYGDPDPWEEFIKGNFTLENINQACGIVNISLEELFGGARDVFADGMVTFDSRKLLELIKAHSIGKIEAFAIWNYLNITTEDVYNVEVFRNYLSEIGEKLNKDVTLGVLTNEREIAVTKKTYQMWKEEKELLTIHAETIQSSSIVTISDVDDDKYKNIITLKYSNIIPYIDDLTSIEIGESTKDILNCNYVTLTNSSVIATFVENAIYANETYQIALNVTEVIQGSPLICNNRVYGLARESVGEYVILDSFTKFSSPSGVPRMLSSGSLLVLIVFVVKIF